MKSKTFSLFILTFSLFLSNCSTEQLLAPTITPTSTNTSLPTSTSASTLTPIPTNTPIPTQIPATFNEDFASDVLNWKTSPLLDSSSDFDYTYSEKGIEFSYELQPKNIYYAVWASPEKAIAIEGDFKIEVSFDRRMRFSGIWFSHDDLLYENTFAILTDQGVHSQDWTKEEACLGVLIPSKNDWTWLGKRCVEPYLAKENGKIHLQLTFKEDEMFISINGKVFTSDKKDVYSGRKLFRGIVVGNGDHFIVESIRIWVDDEKNLEIVNADPLK